MTHPTQNFTVIETTEFVARVTGADHYVDVISNDDRGDYTVSHRLAHHPVTNRGIIGGFGANRNFDTLNEARTFANGFVALLS